MRVRVTRKMAALLTFSNYLQTFISNVLVKQSAHGKEYGSLLMQDTKQQAMAMGYSTVILHVNAHSRLAKIAQNMYLGLGCEPTLHGDTLQYGFKEMEMIMKTLKMVR